MSWMIYPPAVLRAFRSTRNKTRPDHRKPEPVLCRPLLIPASGICLRLIDSFVEVRRGCERDDNINDDGENGTARKEKAPLGS